MELEIATTAFVTLFVIIDPIGLTPLFVSLTSGMTTRRRRAVALRALITGAVILAIFGIGGEFVLAKVGIGMPAFRVSGGILLFLTAIDMLFERRTPRREKTAEDDDGPDPAIFPLAMPLIAGPGAMTTMILLVGQNSGDLTSQLTVYAVMLAVLTIAFLLFMTSGLMERALGQTGINLVTRLMGMFLAALSIQFVLDGLREYGVFGL
jgi:multiple antibiotic resistance protein